MLCVDIVSPATVEQVELMAGGAGASGPVAPEVVARVRQYVVEAVGRLQSDEGSTTPLAEGIDVMATAEGVRVDVHTPRPGALIGPRGATIDALRSGLADLTGGHVALNVVPTSNEPGANTGFRPPAGTESRTLGMPRPGD